MSFKGVEPPRKTGGAMAVRMRALARTRMRIMLLLGLWLISGCATITVPRPAPGPVQASGTFMAGVGKVDLTPPIGLPLFGYSRARPSEANSAGFQTRLYARAIYLEAADGERVALVQTDLGAVSALLHHRVARVIVQETSLTVDRLLLAATHTHSGPGGYFGAAFYNAWGANNAGFDARVLEFLEQRIARAVLEAYRTRAPARLAIGHIQVYGVTHNHSFEAYVNDPPPTALDEAPLDLPPEKRAVDPTFTMIRVDRIVGTGTQPLGAFSNFAIHGTAVAATNNLYSGDVHAAAERGLEWEVQRYYGLSSTVVHALTNGAEGDVTPDYTTQGFAEAERLGLQLAQRAFTLFQQLAEHLTADVHLRHNYEEVALDAGRPAGCEAICERAVVGFPVIGGSEESRSEFYSWLPGAHEGVRYPVPVSCQAWKVPALSPLPNPVPAQDFPTTLTLQTVRINELLLVSVPGEMTTEMGRRVKRTCLQAAQESSQGIQHVAVVGLANQYVSYFATPEEYERQHYEGASTLYGPASGPCIATRLVRLVTQMAVSPPMPVLPERWTFRPGLAVRYFPNVSPRSGQRLAHPVEQERTLPSIRVRFRWQDPGPGTIQLDAPLVRLEAQHSDGHWDTLYVEGIPVDDRGLHIEVRYAQEGQSHDAGMWEALWSVYPPVPAGPLRFAIAARADVPELYSEPFTLSPAVASAGR